MTQKVRQTGRWTSNDYMFYISIKRKFKHIYVDYSNIVDLSDPYSIRMANDKIMQIERTFLVDMPEDWPDKEANRLIKRK